jgi:hypothetical protein
MLNGGSSPAGVACGRILMVRKRMFTALGKKEIGKGQ